ncbi:hypothetical protein BG004_000123 [Podila humilis]|nr:hypothetical protein BG004_000123 [Podila humilis]
MRVIDAATIEGRLLGVFYKGRVSRGVSLKTRVLLNGGQFKAHIDRDGFFEFPNVPKGVYMLEVHSPHLVYSRVRVSVSAQDVVEASRVSVGDHWSSNPRRLSLPLILKPRPRPIHYIPPESAKVVGWFSHPMILMFSFSFVMLLLMPRIMASLDDNALDALRSSYHFSHCFPSTTNYHPDAYSGMHPPTTTTVPPSSIGMHHHPSPYVSNMSNHDMSGSLDYQQHRPSTLQFSSTEPYLVNLNGLASSPYSSGGGGGGAQGFTAAAANGHTSMYGGGNSSNATMASMNNNNNINSNPGGHHNQPMVAGQSKKQR